jgi:membrane protease YdiL (CAAX protease family)
MPERLGVIASLFLFGIPALMLFAATHWLLPRLTARGMEPLLAWFLAGGLLVFTPLLAAALIGAARAAPTASWRERMFHLRLKPMSGRDWRIAALALLVTYALTAAMQQLGAAFWPSLPPHPPFMEVKALSAAQWYIFLFWLPFFFANIVGEELWWRGFIQTRQEPVFGAATWLVQGTLHHLFHLSFGLGILLVVWPIAFAIPWAVQKTRNTTVGIFLHAAINGPGFLAVTLGLLPA